MHRNSSLPIRSTASWLHPFLATRRVSQAQRSRLGNVDFLRHSVAITSAWGRRCMPSLASNANEFLTVCLRQELRFRDLPLVNLRISFASHHVHWSDSAATVSPLPGRGVTVTSSRRS